MMRRFVLTINVLAPITAVTIVFADQPWQWALGVILFAHGLWLWATLVPSCGWWGPVMRQLPVRGRVVWLTIDDGPDICDTPVLLDLLERFGAKATFFLIGEKAERHPELVREIVRRGHEVADHTFLHPAGWFWFFGRGRCFIEISKGLGVLKRIVSGASIRWFRAPAGMRNHHVHPILGELGLSLVGWSVRGRDGTSKNKKRILARLKRGIRPGAIILMHEGRTDHDGERLAPQVLSGLLEWLKSEGYECVIPEN